jgi:hypothetical protein
MAGDPARAEVSIPMSFTVIPGGFKPKPSIPLHRYMYRAIRDIEHVTRTALTCPPTDSWSQYLVSVEAREASPRDNAARRRRRRPKSSIPKNP